MGALYSSIENGMRVALKSGDQLRLSVLRMVVASCKNLEIEKNVKEIEDADVLKILQRHHKQHKESIAQFEKGGRPDLVSKEAAELKVIEAYLPEQMGEDDLAQIVKEAISETGAVSRADTGKVMKAAMAKAQGRADGKSVSAIVARLLP